MRLSKATLPQFWGEKKATNLNSTSSWRKNLNPQDWNVSDWKIWDWKFQDWNSLRLKRLRLKIFRLKISRLKQFETETSQTEKSRLNHGRLKRLRLNRIAREVFVQSSMISTVSSFRWRNLYTDSCIYDPFRKIWPVFSS